MVSQARVLVVEDETDLATLYAGWLDDEYAVGTVHTAGDAIETVDEGTDVVLLDRRLPDGSGQDVLATLRDRGLDARVAMVTAVDVDFDIVRLGFDDYLTKPVSKQTLRSVVETLLTRREYDERLAEYARLVTKCAVLEQQKSESDLAASDEYEDLCARIERQRETIADLTDEFDPEDFRAAFLSLESRPRPADAVPDGA
jgi:DNA-binding response OmpR family regulator